MIDPRRNDLLPLLPTCSQCGESFEAPACGFAHAMIQGCPETHRAFEDGADPDDRISDTARALAVAIRGRAPHE